MKREERRRERDSKRERRERERERREKQTGKERERERVSVRNVCVCVCEVIPNLACSRSCVHRLLRAAEIKMDVAITSKTFSHFSLRSKFIEKITSLKINYLFASKKG